MDRKPPLDAREQRYLHSHEMSDQAKCDYDAHRDEQKRHKKPAKLGEWSEDGKYTRTYQHSKAGLKTTAVKCKGSDHPSGLPMQSINMPSVDSITKEVKRERVLFASLGIHFGHDEIAGWFGKALKEAWANYIPHHPIGPNCFSRRGVLEAERAASACAYVDVEDMAFVTQIMDMTPHQPGRLNDDPRQAQIDLQSFLSKAAPDYDILCLGFQENVIHEVSWSSTSKKLRLLVDMHLNRRCNKGRRLSDRFTKTTRNDWVNGRPKEFINYCIPNKNSAAVLAKAWSETDGNDVALFQCPHFHYVIIMFDKNNKPVPFETIRDMLKLRSTARHQFQIDRISQMQKTVGQIQLYRHLNWLRQKADGVLRRLGHKGSIRRAANKKRQASVRNVMQQVRQCLVYSIKPKGSKITDEDLQFRLLNRGAAPNQGFMSFLISGENRARLSEVERTIGPQSPLGSVMEEFKRMSDVTGLPCFYAGYAERPNQCRQRIRDTHTPLVWKKGKVQRSVYNNKSNNIKVVRSFLKIIYNYVVNPVTGLFRSAKRMLKRIKTRFSLGP